MTVGGDTDPGEKETLFHRASLVVLRQDIFMFPKGSFRSSIMSKARMQPVR
jgi:hypothetical protein